MFFLLFKRLWVFSYRVCKSFKTALLGNSFSFEALKCSTRSDSVPQFMAQLISEKADLSKESGFSHQKLDICQKTENVSEVLLNWKINPV